MKDSSFGVLGRWAVPTLCVVMAVALVYLSYQNIQLKRRLAAAIERPHPNAEFPADRLGKTAVPFIALLPDGQEFRISTDSLSAPLVLAWLSYDCEPCVTALEKWNLLADKCPGQVWGIAEKSGSAFDPAFLGEGVRFPILTPISDSLFWLYEINATPQTMIVKENGTIGNTWYGPLNDHAYQEIINILQQTYSERR